MAWLMHYSDALKINYLIFPRSTQAPSKPGSLTLFSNKHSKTKTHSCLRLSSCYHYYKTLFINVWISDAKLSLFPMLGLMAIFQFLFFRYTRRFHQCTGICVDDTDFCVLSPIFCVLYTDFCVKGTIFWMQCTGYCVMCTGFCVKSLEIFHIIINLGKKKMEF